MRSTARPQSRHDRRKRVALAVCRQRRDSTAHKQLSRRTNQEYRLVHWDLGRPTRGGYQKTGQKPQLSRHPSEFARQFRSRRLPHPVPLNTPFTATCGEPIPAPTRADSPRSGGKQHQADSSTRRKFFPQTLRRHCSVEVFSHGVYWNQPHIRPMVAGRTTVSVRARDCQHPSDPTHRETSPHAGRSHLYL